MLAVEPYYSVQWYLVCLGFPKVKACDGSLAPVNHYYRGGPNAIFIVLRRNLVLYFNEPGEMCLIVSNKGSAGAGSGGGGTGGEATRSFSEETLRFLKSCHSLWSPSILWKRVYWT